MILYGQSGATYEIGSECFKKGGEGSLYLVKGRPNIVLKVYHDPKMNNRCAKIIEMTRIAPGWSEPFLKYTAPPIDPVFNSAAKTPGSFVGYTMRKLLGQYRTLAEIYDAKRSASRSYRNKINTCRNLCVLTDLAHQNNVIIGDYNQKNIGVDAYGILTLFDNDSFQISDKYRCVVGVPEEMAPEILLTLKKEKTDLLHIGRPVYNKYTDRYSMALHIFHLLMNGAHPFNHRIDASQLPESKTVSDVMITTAQAAAKREFIIAHPTVFRKPPKFVPSYSILPKGLQDLFERAFVDGRDHPEKRPSAKEFYDELEKYRQSLQKHPSCNRHHLYSGYTGECEWCRIEKYLKIRIKA